jgi:hypothetical protein
MKPPNRKRQRPSVEPDEEAIVVSRDRTHPPFITTHPSIWHGLTIVVSTRQPPVVSNPKEEEEEEASPPSSHHSYKSLTQLCRTLGATVTAQVHGQVHCVLATAEARHPAPTQRVRKAWQRGIPVVSLAWLEECQSQRILLPLTNYRVVPPSIPPTCTWAHPSNKSDLATTNDESAAAVLRTETLVDLKCCCACHDVYADSGTPCEWCVDCSVQRAQNPAS